ncbi:MAG: arginine--tRNA ligase [Holosporales bacterium]|nr:arginine--tRNA ligase [Holosporales bacterium]
MAQETQPCDLFLHFESLLQNAIEQLARSCGQPLPEAIAFSVETPKERAFGDLSTNAAMVLAKEWERSPRDIAIPLQKIVEKIPGVAEVNTAGAGFLNITLTHDFLLSFLGRLVALGENYGRSTIGQKQKVNIEYVSANPTGPLHAGHLRGAVTGDVLATLLTFVGFDVTREYYINDAGHQIDVLADTLYYRYLQLLGKSAPQPMEFYPGEYVISSAQRLIARDGTQWCDHPNWRPCITAFAVDDMMCLIKEDLEALGIRHDHFSSERALVEVGKVDAALDFLNERELIYEGVLTPPKGKLVDDWEARPQTLFRATQFGDDIDRPLKKSDGSWTYFATDIAYHFDKIHRGFTTLIDFWGADHGGYVKRMTAAVRALSITTPVQFDARLCQIVRFIKDNKEVRMSKRAGTFVEAKDVLDNVGKDAVRFFMLTRRDNAPLDFDFAKVVEETRDNPVFYVQYAHARACSVLRQCATLFPDISSEDCKAVLPFKRDLADQERTLIKILLAWPRQVLLAARLREPHRIAFYLLDLAAAFHALWTTGKDETTLRFIHPKDIQKTRENMVFVYAVQNVLSLGLHIAGVTPVAELH